MSELTGNRRPPQVTWGAALTVVCGVLLVATAFDALAQLHSVDTREQLTKALDSAEARRLGVSIDQATTALHGLLLVGGAAAAVAAVLGGYAYRRHTGARAGLAVVAVVALIGSLAADPLLGALLVLGAGLLWSAPARVWFRPELAERGTPGAAPATEPERGSDAAPPPSAPPPTAPPSAEPPSAQPPVVQPALPPSGAQPPPTYGFGEHPAAPPHPYAAQPVRPVPVVAARSWRPPIPGTVKAAVALTWTCCVLALIGLVAAAAVLANDRARVIEVLRQQPGYDRFADHEDALVAALWFVDGAFALWTVVAAVLAVFVLRGHEWARVLLLVSAGVAVVVSMAAFPASVFHIVGSAVVFGLLLSRSATTWFRQRRAVPAAPPGWPPPPTGHDHRPPDGDGPPPVW